ncbi:MAG: sulfatase-like hydrolase/transferase, partial [Gemmatimonadales bacterium]
MPRLPPEDHPPAWFIPALALAVAIGTGLLEVPVALLRRELFALPVEGDEHLPWMAAVANIVIMFLPAALAWIIHRKWPTRRVEHVIAFVLFWTAAFALLRYIPRMSSWGMLVLAAGLGFQAAKVAMRDRARLHALAGRAAVILSSLLLVYGAGAFAWAPLRERLANGSLGPAPAGAPNVLLLVLDTVRSASLGLYGHERATTPELERWARSGTVFEQATATSSWTLPSHAGLFTGRYVHQLAAGFR